MAQQIECKNRAHGVSYHRPGTKMAAECSALARTPARARSVAPPILPAKPSIRSQDEVCDDHPNNWTDAESVKYGEKLWTTTLPSDLGWPDDGNSYDALSEEMRKEFEDSQTLDDTPIAEHPIPANLHPIQDFINDRALDYYRAGGEPVLSPYHEDRIDMIVKVVEGTPYVFQGTHRFTVMREQGATHFTGRMIHIS